MTILRLSSILIACFLSFHCGSSSSVTKTESGVLYANLKTGSYWTYQYFDAPTTSTTSIIEENVLVNGKKYFKIERKYSWGTVSTDYSRVEDGVVYTYDDITGAESVWLPKELSVGMKWKHADGSWEYTVMDLDASIKTPVGSYENLFHLRARQLTGRDGNKHLEYDLYFQKGIGQVASKGEGEWMSYLIETNVE